MLSAASPRSDHTPGEGAAGRIAPLGRTRDVDPNSLGASEARNSNSHAKMASSFATSFITAQTRRKGMMEQQHTSIALEQMAVQELTSRMPGELLRPVHPASAQALRAYKPPTDT